MNRLERYKGYYAECGLWRRACLMLLLVGSGFFLLCSIVFLVIAVASAGNADYDPMVGILGDVRMMCILQDVCIFILPALVGGWLLYRRPLREALFVRRVAIAPLLLGVAAFSLLIPFVDAVGQINMFITFPESWSAIEEKLRQSTEDQKIIIETMLGDARLSILLYNLFVIALMAGLSEELFFRGLLMRLCMGWGNVHVAVWLAAFVFSFIHFDFYGFLPRLLLGGMMGYLCVYLGLWAAVLVHVLNNALIILSYPDQPYNANWEWTHGAVDYALPLPFLLVSTILGIALFLWLARRHRRLSAPI